MTLIDQERDEAFALSYEGLRLARLGQALLRDAMPTAAEMETKLVAYAECLEYDGEESPPACVPWPCPTGALLDRHAPTTGATP